MDRLTTNSPLCNNNLIYSYPSMFGDKEVKVYYTDNNVLKGAVYYKDKSLPAAENLPLEGVPREVRKSRNIQLFKEFFQYVHLSSMGVGKSCYRLKVHISGKGGAKQKIPFQPGLALGSVVKGATIEKMEEYGEKMACIERVESEIRELEQQMKVLKEKERGLTRGKKPLSSFNKEMLRLAQVQQKNLEKRIREVPKKLAKIQSLGLPSFGNITTSIETPIDFDITEVSVDARGFDSIQYNSQYIDLTESTQRIHDKMDQSSRSSSVNASASFGGFFVSGKVSTSHSWSSAAMDRVADIKNQGHASKILVINAVVTTRYVKRLKNLTFKREKLKSILNIMNGSSGPKNLKKLGITARKNEEKAIYLLTEAVMGGSFTGIVTYLKKDESSRNVKDSAKHSSSDISTTVSAKASFFGIGAKGSTGFNRASQKANESHRDDIANRGNIDVVVEFIAQGAIPQLAKETVVREALKFQDQNLRKYHNSGSEKVKGSVYDRQKDLQDAMYNTINAIQKTAVSKEDIVLHKPSSLINAYDDFCGKLSNDPKAGVPIGFNYSILTKSNIESILGLKKQEKTTTIANTRNVVKETEESSS